MEQITNKFDKGLNKDINKINFPTNTYHHLQNGRVLTDEGSSSFSVSNIEGNSLFSNEVTSLYPEYVIIGYVNIRKDIVLFLAEENNNGSGKIIIYKEVGNTYNIITLYENDELNFLPGYPIEIDGVVGRYESPEVIKIYWTDTNNPLRFLNIAPDIGTDGTSQSHYTKVNSTPIDKLELTSKVSFTQPEFSGFISGSLNSGMVQYAYRLYNLRGSETIFSPASSLIPLTKYSDTNGTQRLRGQSTGGQAIDTNTGKGVSVKITLDTEDVLNFDRIEVVSLWYSDENGIPTISIIDRKSVSEVIYVNDEGGSAEYGTIELEEYQTLSQDFKCRSIAEKDNRLFAANISETYFDVDYDARAYRYYLENFSDLYGQNGSIKYIRRSTDIWTEQELTSGDPYVGTYTSTSNTYTTELLPDTIDAANRFNILDYDDYTNPCKYQSDGSTLGGEGINVSYEFEEVSYTIAPNISSANAILDLNVDINIDNRDWIFGTKKSFQRDEVYRFGIVFFDKKGNSSYVKWIGDIRIPSIKEFPLTNISTTIDAVSLVPKFTVINIPTIDNEILDYQIVYVKRENEDKTIISQGVGSGLINEDSGDTEYFSPIRISPISDYVDGTYSIDTGDVSNTLFEYISPDINFDNNFSIPLHRMQVEAGLQCPEHSYRPSINEYFTLSTDYNDYYDGLGADNYSVKKYTSILPLVHPTSIGSDILESYVLIPSAEETGKVSFISGDTVKHWCDSVLEVGSFINKKNGQKGTSGVFEVDTSLPTTVDYYGLGAITSTNTIFLINIKNNIIGYGGNTYNDRQLNTYIPAGDLNSQYCYNGDTFICMYDYLRTIRSEAVSNLERASEIIYFPIETKYNLFYRYDDSFSRIYNYGEGAAITDEPFYLQETGYVDLTKGINWTPLYTEYYDAVYSKVDNSKIYYPKPVDFSDNNIFDTQIKYSDLKLNGEERDSWISFKPNNFNEVTGSYGQINSLVEFNNTIFVFQEKGICVAAINRQEIVSSDIGVATVLGSGGILDRFDYISTDIGVQGRNKIIKSLQALYWLDLNNKKVYTYNKGITSLDELKGLNSWFEKGLSSNTIMKGIYDNKYAEVLMTFSNIVERIETTESYTKPSCVIKFTSIIADSKIFLSLNNTEYSFIASDTSNTGQFFKVEVAISDTIDNLKDAIERFTNSNYTVTKVDNGDSTFNLEIVGLIDDLGNLNPKIEVSNVGTATPGGSNTGTDGITIQDYTANITKPNTIFYADCDAYGVPDKFEILVNPPISTDQVVDWAGNTYVVASTHQTDVRVLNGTVTNFDTSVDITTPTNPGLEWYIGTNNGTVPTGVQEFEDDTGVAIPIYYQQRIWTTVSPGDTVYIRASGTAGTGWKLAAGTLTTAEGNIDVISKTDITKIIDSFPVLSTDSILDTTSNGNIINVEDVEYFNLRVGNKYTINNTRNTTITEVTSSSFITDKEFGVSDVDLAPYAKYKDNFTVAYNEIIQGFSGFYDFLPTLYIKYIKGFLTTINNKSLWVHNNGDQCSFYGVVYDSYVDIVVTNSSSAIKEFNNLEYYSEVYKDSQLLANETLYSVQVENDYQQSEEVILYPLSDDKQIKELRLAGNPYRKDLYTEGNNIPISSPNFENLANIRRVIDHWRTAVPRVITIDDRTVSGDYNIDDYDDNDYYVFSQNADAGLNTYDRIRSPYCKFRLKFKNEENKEFILHQINTIFQPMIV